MSRLTDLLAQAQKLDPQLGADLADEVRQLARAQRFGLVFERHQPEAVELPGRPVRRNDRVKVLPPRGSVEVADKTVWTVTSITRAENGSRCAELVEDLPMAAAESTEQEPRTCTAPIEDLVVLAHFEDPIFPGLKETGRVEQGGTDKPFHTVINAENFHALELLTYTHRYQVDCIYIDPPYNTGAKDWKYNNDYVEADDDYRHSKWLSFMERRLKVAKELLNPDDSVLIVTIDEKEYLRLGLLLQQTFTECDVQMISGMINKKGSSRPGRFSRSEEYIYFVFIGDSYVTPTSDNMLLSGDTPSASTKKPTIWNSLLRRGDAAARRDRSNMFYPVWVNVETEQIEMIGDPLPAGLDRTQVNPPHDGLVACWPLRSDGSEGRWQVGSPRLRTLVDSGFAKRGSWNKKTQQWSVLFLKSGQIEALKSGALTSKGRDDSGAHILEAVEHTTGMGPFAAPRSLWARDKHDASIYGSTLLRSVLPGRKFPFPKSLYAVEDTLRFVVSRKPDAIILDFFSGSGTTAHAVMRLNKQDGGRRQCISVTNNEVSAGEQKALRKQGLRPGDSEWEALGICDYVTKPRVTAAITGQTPKGTSIKGSYKFTDEFPMADGFQENAAFFTLTYETPAAVRHHRAFGKVAPMLWLKAGARGRIIEELGERGWDVAESYAVIEALDDLPAFLAALESANDVVTVFVVTDSSSSFQATCRQLPEHVSPVRLYESYLHNFEINRRA